VAVTERLPGNLEAERLVLGSILLDGERYPQVAETLRADDFSLEKHRLIWATMGRLYEAGKPIDHVTVGSALHDRGELEACDGLSYVVSLDDGLPRIINLDGYVGIVRDKAALRRIYTAARQLANRCLVEQENPGELIEYASRALLDLIPQQREELQTPFEVIQEAGLNSILGGKREGVIETPIAKLNEYIIGFHPGELILIGARPSVGKTALALQIAHHAARNGHGTILFSLEMGKLPLSVRLACSAANVDSQLMRLGVVGVDDRRRFMRVLEEIRELPLWFDKRARTVPAIHATIRRARTKHNIKLVLIDYLQLMESAGCHENRNQEVSAISRGLKLMAEEFNLPVIALSQFSRPAKHTNPEPELTDLRESGSLEQDADLAVLMHAPQGNEQPERLLLIKKQRNGPLGTVPQLFIGKYQRFESLAMQSEER
jgi:replicative DNA helicase